jgi:rhodanese-related sulfurtransferase
MLAATLLAGCGSPAPAPEPEPEPTPAEEPAEEPEEEPEEELDAAEVIEAHSKAYFANIPDNSNMVPVADVLQMIEDNPDAILLVDMRAAEDYEAGHLPGAVHVPFPEFANSIDKFPATRQIIVYCYSGQNSAQGVAALNLLGFNALSMQSGMNFGWAPLELGEETLETEANELGTARDLGLDAEQQILFDAISEYFAQGTNHIVPPADVHTLLEDNPDAISVVDIRSADDYAAGHIEGAIHIGFREIGERMSEISTVRPVYLTCYSGQTAGQAHFILRLNGFNSFTLNRGMAGWTNAELPVVTE